MLMSKTGAPYPANILTKLFALYNAGEYYLTIRTFLVHIYVNIVQYFFTYKSREFPFYFYKITLFLLMLLVLYRSYKTRDKFTMSVAIVSWLSFIALFTLYDAYAFREHRTFANIYVMLIFWLVVSEKEKIIITSLIAIHIILFSLSIPKIINGSRNNIKAKDKYEELYSKNIFTSIRKLEGEKRINIKLPKTGFYGHGDIKFTLLPLYTDKGIPIMYAYEGDFEYQYLLSYEKINDAMILEEK